MICRTESPSDSWYASERELWAHVVLQAVRDATSKAVFEQEDRFARAQARIWIEGNSEDFREACDYAGIDPDSVREFWYRYKKRQKTGESTYGSNAV